ncbi:MAG TPA: hypothetical protein VJT15_25475 [Pyrinomonadaceae bacterium]|nr:hypothetical protein [Pyrinomonadaceae bacterium]
MKKVFTFASVFCSLLLLPALAVAQNSNRSFPSRVDTLNGEERPLTEIEEELRAKQAIKFAEKGHQENLNRAKEIAEIGKGLKASVANTPLLSRDSSKKIERLEKLTRKIRDEAGGDDQEVKLDTRPSNVPTALNQIAEAAESLSKDVQNTPRQVVSATVIGNANVLLELIKIVRTLTR